MRQFLLIAHEAPTTGEFALDDLTGAGRMDLLARVVTAAFLRSHGIRADVRVRLVLGRDSGAGGDTDEVFTIRFEGAELQGLNPDERSTAALMRAALDQREAAIGRQPVETSPGVYLTRQDLEAALAATAAEGTVIRLHESGQPVADSDVPADPAFVLSDHRDLTDAEASLVADAAAARVSLGPVALHADHAVAVAHNWLDTDGFERY
jgi:tRNA (pseudouridine54-N1)-methyltransferase